MNDVGSISGIVVCYIYADHSIRDTPNFTSSLMTEVKGNSLGHKVPINIFKMNWLEDVITITGSSKILV